MTNRATDITFPVFTGFKLRVILSRNMVGTGHRLGTDLANCAGAFIKRADKPGRGWLVFDEKPDAATIAHEASHAVRELFRHAGVHNDEETFAYCLDYLVGRIHKFIDRG